MKDGFPAAVREQSARSGLGNICDKLLNGERLSAQDGEQLYETRNLNVLGAMANAVRERKHGNTAYFNRNVHINYTNECRNECRFCAFSRRTGEEGAYTMTEQEIAAQLQQWKDCQLSEVHIVGGINPDLPFSYYVNLLKTVRKLHPDAHIKAFTMVEIAWMIGISEMGPEDTIQALKSAGLGSCPGGGCEILSPRIHQLLYPRKISPEKWLEMQRLVHRCGLRSNATMLYGHIETASERIGHMVQLRELQDETGGFQAFVPLAFHPQNTSMREFPATSGALDLKTIAVARLMLDNFAHIKAYWVMLGPKLAQASLSFGADDIDGTVLTERITHEAGAQSPKGLTLEALLSLIRGAGRTPVERDTLYRPV